MTDPITVMNEDNLDKRRALALQAGQHFAGERDIYEVMGYPRHLSVEHFMALYDRQDIAERLVDAYPDATWREPPEILGDDSFKKAFQKVADRLNLWRIMHRADRLMNLGHYGVIFLGLDGGENPALPAEGSDYNLLFMQPHSERTAQITRWEDDPKSPRFGLPLYYRLTSGTNWTGAGANQTTFSVHHSRVIHVAEKAMEDVSIGTPRLKSVFNRLMDLDKLLGGSAEMYWQNVAMLLHFNADASSEWAPGEAEKMQEQMEEMQNRLRRMIRTRGVEGQNLAPGLQGADPGSHIDKQIQMVAGAKGIPQRILLGNEAGELASTQDETAWQGRVAERREQLATPVFLDQFVAKGTRLGFLPSGYEGIKWPESDTLGERGRAEVAAQTAAALQNYTNALGGEDVVSPKEFREILGFEGELKPSPDSADTLEEDSGFTPFRRRAEPPLRAVGDDE